MGLSDEFITIDTPENVVFGFEIAGLGSRFLAALIDSLILVFGEVIVYMTLLGGARLVPVNTPILRAILTAVLGLIGFILLWGYFILFELLWNGQSPGKRLVKLRVIRVDGTPISLTESIIRNLVRLIDFLPLSYGIGVVAMFLNKQSRRLGDLAAGTLVVHDQGELTLESLSGQRIFEVDAEKITAADPTLAVLPIDRLQEEDILLVEEFLSRRAQIVNRNEITRNLVMRFQERLAVTLDQSKTYAQWERWLDVVALLWRARRDAVQAPASAGT